MVSPVRPSVIVRNSPGTDQRTSPIRASTAVVLVPSPRSTRVSSTSPTCRASDPAAVLSRSYSVVQSNRP